MALQYVNGKVEIQSKRSLWAQFGNITIMGNYITGFVRRPQNVIEYDFFTQEEILEYIINIKQVKNLKIDASLTDLLKDKELVNESLIPMCFELYGYIVEICPTVPNSTVPKKKRSYFIRPRFQMEDTKGDVCGDVVVVPDFPVNIYKFVDRRHKMAFGDVTLDEFNAAFDVNILTKKDMIGIDKKMLQYIPDYMKTRFINRFNEHVFTFVGPAESAIGKCSYIYKIAKRGPTDDIKSFRPIMAIPTIVNHFHRILALRLNKYVLDNNLMDTTIQKGGISGQNYGLFEQFFKIKKAVKIANKEKRPLCVLFLDITNAFGNLDRKNMFAILKKYDIDVGLLRYIDNFYNNLHYFVKLGEDMSDLRKWGGGLIQGCPLSPLLFVLTLNFVLRYLDDMYKDVNGFNFGGVSMLLSAYMDDICIVTHCMEGLAEVYGQFANLMTYLGLPISKEKSGLMTVGDVGEMPAGLEGITRVDKYKYLGEIIYNTGEYSESFALFLRTLNGKLNTIDEKFANVDGVDKRVETFRMYLIPFIQRKMLIMYDLNTTQRMKIIGIIKEFITKWGAADDVQLFTDIRKVINASNDNVITQLDFNDRDVDFDLAKTTDLSNYVLNEQGITLTYEQVNKGEFDTLDDVVEGVDDVA